MSNKRPWTPAPSSANNLHRFEPRNEYVERLRQRAELSQLRLEQLQQSNQRDQSADGRVPDPTSTSCANSRLLELRQLQWQQSEAHFLAMCRSNLSRQYIALSEESNDSNLNHIRKYQSQVSPLVNIPPLAFDEGTMMQRKRCNSNRSFDVKHVQPPGFPRTPVHQTLPESLSVPQPSWHKKGEKEGFPSARARNVSNSDNSITSQRRHPNTSELLSCTKPKLITPQVENDNSDSSSDDDSTSSGSSETVADSPPPPPKLDQMITIPQPPLLRVQRDGSYRIFKANDDGTMSYPTPRRKLHQEKYNTTREQSPTNSASDQNTTRTLNLSPTCIPLARPPSSILSTPPGLAFTVEDDGEVILRPPKRQCGTTNSVDSFKK